jgi:hypothetical protein
MLRSRIFHRTKLIAYSIGAKKRWRRPASPGLRARFVMKLAGE